ncbi:hypothetical protein FQN55_006130 [Onygenales sp. PD_40]|nr:hypothetical protein FQN55_006130 [Onygenales sp. PD_40]
MPKKETFNLHPHGYETHPEVERFPLSTFDYLTAQTYNNFAVYFKLGPDASKPAIATILKQGLEHTLSQCRHLAGYIAKNKVGDHHSFVKKRDSTVQFVVQYLDGPEDNFPSFAELERTHFVRSTLGDISALGHKDMQYGERPECSPDALPHPIASAFQANFIPGGLIFSMHHHHYANDIKGWAGFTHQLAENCHALSKGLAMPSWDMACLDHTRCLPREDIPEEAKVDGPPSPGRHPDLRECSMLLFHLPKSKAAELKSLAIPADGGSGSWISSYDAFSAFIWRIMTKHRAPLYKTDVSGPSPWGEAVDMRQRLKNPPVPERLQGNLFAAAVSMMSQIPPLTVAEVISEAPLARLAAYIRSMTNSQTEESFDQIVQMIAPVRDKSGLFVRVNSFPPPTVAMTDWRQSRICEGDFGFARPAAFRFLTEVKAEGIVYVFPPRPTGNADEGIEVQISCEKELVSAMIADKEMGRFFEYRGVEE